MGFSYDLDSTQLKGATDGTLIGNSGDKLKVDGSGVTQPVSAVSLPLPTGAATSAAQTTANNSLASIDAGIPNALGQTTMAASMPVVIASNQTTIPVSGSVTIGPVTGNLWDGYQPDPSNADTLVPSPLALDASNRLEIHFAGSDEGGTREDFEGNALVDDWTSAVTGSATVTVASGRVSLTSGTANGNAATLNHYGDYCPMTLTYVARVTQRINNQTTVFGFSSNVDSPTKQAVVIFDGTTNTTCKFRTSWGSAASETQETLCTLPNALTTAVDQSYNISVSNNQAALAINGTVVARHMLHIPGPYDAMDIVAKISNAGTVSSSIFSADLITWNNYDNFQVDNDKLAEPLSVQVYTDTSTSYNSVVRTELSNAAANGRSFYIITNSLLSAASATELIYFNNPSSNNKTILICNVLLGVSLTTSAWTIFDIYYNPTVTSNGTPMTVRNSRIGGAYSGGILVYTLPVVSSNGTLYSTLPFNNSSQSGSSVPIALNPYWVLPPGNSLFISSVAKVGSTPLNIQMNWLEV